ncbi:sigma-70 family RNA polymerase sigma factor [Chitinophaga arvensicola]|uniref:RNA polymerase sigma factor, sigma-70 family n=1 Tax=Chitinophaga arvensicola TaxID=29529 RepID=A0A1I0QZ58_9BACT|nr:sigma-70 family RNA polymerase sigma factor [Chitinophaga arvensicola]SEW32409.1 RNA polymerase sigma factor, sigma-70 family [Chitinophaga arvensicola]
MKIIRKQTDSSIGNWDKEHFQLLFSEYYPVTCKYIYSIINNAEQAKDLSAELFCNLWQQDPASIHTSFKNYLLVCARRSANRYLQQLSRERNRQEEVQQLIDLADEQTPDQHQQLVNRELKQQLEKILQTMSPIRREIIELKLLGLNNKEIAVVMQLSYKKVEYQLKSAIRELQEEIRLHPDLVFLLLPLLTALS